MQRTQQRRAFLIASSASLLGFLSGCGKKGRPGEKPVFTVTGKVTWKGEPMAHAVLTFSPVGEPFAQALKSRANCDKDGVYQLTTYFLNDGAPEGEYVVSLYWPVTPPKPDDLERPDPPDRLKHVYSDPAKSKLRKTVRPEPNTLDIELP